jgi:hypothetical protein
VNKNTRRVSGKLSQVMSERGGEGASSKAEGIRLGTRRPSLKKSRKSDGGISEGLVSLKPQLSDIPDWELKAAPIPTAMASDIFNSEASN